MSICSIWMVFDQKATLILPFSFPQPSFWLFWERVVGCQKCFEESDIWLHHCHRNMICEMRMSHWIRPWNHVSGFYKEKIDSETSTDICLQQEIKHLRAFHKQLAALYLPVLLHLKKVTHEKRRFNFCGFFFFWIFVFLRSVEFVLVCKWVQTH